VIVILAVLTATALPRFFNLEEKATEAVLKGALTSMKSAARIGNVYARTETADAAGDVDIDGDQIFMVNGYPVARPAGNGTAFIGLEALMEIDNELSITYNVDGTGTATDNSRPNATDDTIILFSGTQCVSYMPPQAAGDDPVFSDGVLTYTSGATPTCL
jgi:MSHA pilin protein MshA